MKLLNHALAQTDWPGGTITLENWRPIVIDRLKAVVWDRVVGDVRPFLERREDVDLLTRENLLQLLSPS